MNKPNLKQILSDMEEGKIVSRVFIKEALEYAIELEERDQRPLLAYGSTLQLMSTRNAQQCVLEAHGLPFPS